MFNELGYIDEFDIVIATFHRRASKYSKLKQSDFMFRLANLPEKQICVKNAKVINNISEYPLDENFDKLVRIKKDINKEISFTDNKGYNYNIRKKPRYKQ
jgi:hypothetical protein